eukprot:3688157-Pyramimonas_sp.AAC.1
MPGGLVRIHALGATLALKHGSHANGGKQPHQSIPLDKGVSCSPTTTLGVKRVSTLSAFGKGNPAYRGARG